MNFFITGLPRSRTAWLANLFTTGPIFCWHDGLKNSRDWANPVDGLVEKSREARRTFEGVEYLGDSDSGAVFFTSKIITAFPAAKWVFIHRAFEDCLTSFKNSFPNVLTGRNAFESANQHLHGATALVPAKNQIVVDFADLDNVETVRAVWNFCVPHEPFPEYRWALLNTLRVNVIAEKAYRGLI